MTMHRPTLKPLFHAVVVLPIFTLGLATAALADDDKTYVGAECRTLNSVDSQQAVLEPDTGAMINIGQRSQTWICPVVRDSVDDKPEFARITALENGTAQVNCTFEARDPQGGNPASASFDKRDVSVLQTNPLRLAVSYSYGSGENVVLDNVKSHGYYYFKCDVPGSSSDQKTFAGVVTYIVTEQGG
jgi:hypothetical protein